ncbi:MAG: tetratricopeptide repeat protein, partial [Thermodesulfobacteriota bacterium]
SVIYVLDPVRSLFEFRSVFSLLIVSIYAVAVIYFRKKEGRVFFFLLWILVPILPVLYLPALAASPFAERYLYLPSIGFALLLTFGFCYLHLKFSANLSANQSKYGWVSKAISCTIVLLAFFYYIGTKERVAVWNNQFSLWTDAAIKRPESTHAHYNLAWLYQEKRENKKAIYHYNESLRIDPRAADAHYNLGLLYLSERMLGDAEREFNAALDVNPTYKDAARKLQRIERLRLKVGK